MLKSSRCSVVFPTNGLALSGQLSFQPGITAVVGRNGKGKTFRTIELWRYLLFGKKALRGPASDYKTLDAEGEFSIRGVDYRVERKPKVEALWEGDKQLATGADAVNKKITELLGFGLDVFDITNASVQKESNRLTQLRPAQRKELIDEVVGLAQNERVEKECKDKAKLLKLEADTIHENMVVPVQPVRPPGYRPSREVEQDLKEARRVATERASLMAVITRCLPPKPDKPRFDAEEVKAHEQERIAHAHRRVQLQTKIDGIPVTTLTMKDVEAAETYFAYEAELERRGGPPTVELAEVQSMMATWHRLHALETIRTEVECPECNHSFVPSHSLPDRPALSQTECANQIRRHESWSTPLPIVPKTELSGAEVVQAKMALTRTSEREALVKALEALPDLDDRSAELEEGYARNAAWDRYERAMQEYNAANFSLSELPDTQHPDELNEAFVQARIFEEAERGYALAQANHDELVAKITKLREEGDEFTKGAKRLAEARRELKAYLAPSLSRIASAFITDMTCGKLMNVSVDEDMNISVDGQDVATLSGAGATAANLALRLALGRALVGGVFPVFIGDEIDSDADEERSEAIFECLRNLGNQFSQVIVITHKPHVTADHVIDMDE